MLLRSVHFKGAREAITILWLSGEGGGEPARMRVHVEVIVLHL